MEDNQLVIVASQTGLDTSKVNALMQKFIDSFKEAKSIVQQAKLITVTDETQADKMLEARASRLKLKEIRVSVEKTRVELKAQSLRESNAIDGMANIIKALIIPVEQHLEKQEKFAEEQEKLRLEKRNIERISKLSQYVADTSIYSVIGMTDLAFDTLLNTCKIAHEATKKAQEEAEKKRLADIEAKRKEDERIRKENEKLKLAREKDLIKMKKLKDKKDELDKKERERLELESKNRLNEIKRKNEELRKPEIDQYRNYLKKILDIDPPTVKDPKIAFSIIDLRNILNQYYKKLL